MHCTKGGDKQKDICLTEETKTGAELGERRKMNGLTQEELLCSVHTESRRRSTQHLGWRQRRLCHTKNKAREDMLRIVYSGKLHLFSTTIKFEYWFLLVWLVIPQGKLSSTLCRILQLAYIYIGGHSCQHKYPYTVPIINTVSSWKKNKSHYGILACFHLQQKVFSHPLLPCWVQSKHNG